MNGQLGTASDVLANQLAELQSLPPDSASASAMAACAAQLATLNALQRTLVLAKGGSLAALRADIGAAVAAASAVGQQARAATESNAAGAAFLAATSAVIRQEVASLADDLFNRRIFDSYMRFASPEEEAAYREREAERQSYIEQQLAKGTPEGELNAAGATAGQMLDANAHGAGDSPDFLPRWNRLVETTRKHREAMRQAGQSTEEYDRNVTESVRRFLKSKGLTDAEIDARLQSTGDPLEAAAPYLKTEQDARALDGRLFLAGKSQTDATMEVVAAPAADSTAPPVAPPGLEDVMAKLRASGVAQAAYQPEEQAAHGLTAQERPTPTKPSVTLG